MSNKVKHGGNIVNIKKSHFEYETIEKYTAGVVLSGWMVKSIRAGKISASDGAYVQVKNGEMFLLGIHLRACIETNTFSPVMETPTIKLLLNKREIERISSAVNEKGLTVVLHRLYWQGHLVKADISLARGKNLQDKRRTIKEREGKIEADRAMKVRLNAR